MKRINQYTEKFQQEQKQTTLNKFKKELEIKDYYTSSKMEYNLLTVAGFAANIISILTASTFVYFQVYNVVPSVFPVFLKTAAAASVSAFVLLLIEVIKRKNLSAFFVSLLVLKRAQIKTTAAAVLLSAVSVLLSVFGAVNFAEYSKDKSSVLISTYEQHTSELKAQSKKEIDELKAGIKELEKTTAALIKKRVFARMPDKTAEQIEAKRKEIQQIRDERQNDTEAASVSFERSRKGNDNSTQSAVLSMLVIALLAESLTVFAMWFCSYYKYRSITEMETQQTSIQGHRQHETPKTKDTITESVKQSITANCRTCAAAFTPRALHQVYCSPDCRKNYHK